MSSRAKRDMSRRSNEYILKMFCTDFDMVINPLNNGYQLRVENLVDFYPVNGRYCILQTGERGDWSTAQDLRRIMLKAIDQPSKALVDNWVGANSIQLQGTLPYKGHEAEYAALGVIPNVKTMSEAEYMKWYRRLWRKLWRTK